ncbi:MAG: OmpA family protein, partial [Endomicrobium sp.]|nr:OmpA family protein [Endomicrobium sp.]
NIWVNDNISIAPYGHIKSGYVRNYSSREKGRAGANIEIYENDYLRTEGRLGVGINYVINRLSLYCKVSGGYVMAGDRAEYSGEFLDSGEKMEIWGTSSEGTIKVIGIGAEYEIADSLSIYTNVNGNYYNNGREYYGNIGLNYSFAMVEKERREEIENKIIQEIITEKEIINIFETKGEKNASAEIKENIREKLGLEEGKEVSVLKYSKHIFFFKEEEDVKKFKNKIKEAGGRVSGKKVKRVLDGGKLSFKGYEKELGDMREGVLILQYENGLNEIKAIPEEARRAQRNTIIESVLEESQASMVWEMEVENDNVKISKEVVGKLGIKEGSSIYLLNYGRRIFLFKNRVEAAEFLWKLMDAGANIDEENIREIEGVEVKNEDVVGINVEELKDIGDLSKGIRFEHYGKDNTTEVKSVAEEEKRSKEEEITKEKVEGAIERRQKPMIKKYKLNVANFGLNEYSLTNKAKQIIAQEAKEIRKYDYTLITVEGHTDSTGREEINEKISRSRAQSVYKEFLLNGIPAGKIGFIGYGSRVPIATNAAEEGRAANRRTEIYVE